MKGLSPSGRFSDSSDEEETTERRKTAVKKPSLRNNSECEETLNVVQEVPVSASSNRKPRRPKTSYEPARFRNDNQHSFHEVRDKLTQLPSVSSRLPRKSILKHRKHSFDDLDVSTRKGLALYLHAKQREQQIHHANVHFT